MKGTVGEHLDWLRSSLETLNRQLESAGQEQAEHWQTEIRAIDTFWTRLADKFAVCRAGRYVRVSSYFPHFGEKDCLRGTRGCGTIFFSGCNLRCVFCQNFEVSWQVEGNITPPDQLAAMMLKLQARGCHNINLVTPEHVVPQILEGLLIAVEGGLRLPLVYNTSAYDSLDSLELMSGLVDIYMPDFKFWDAEMARRYIRAPNHPEAACRAIKEASSTWHVTPTANNAGRVRVLDFGLAAR